MSVFKKIIPFVGIFAMLFLPVSSAQAAGVYTGSTSYWDQLLLGMVHGTSSIPLIGDAVQGIAGGLAGGVCSSSSDGLHYTSAISDDKVYEDSTGYFSFGTCAYCGDRFKVYGADLASAYETQVAELPATSVGSDGYLYWVPNYMYSRFVFYISSSEYSFYWGNTAEESSESFNFSVSSEHDPGIFSFYPDNKSFYGRIYQYYNDSAPVDGYYYISSMDYSGYYVRDATRSEISSYYGQYSTSGSFFNANDTVSGSFYCYVSDVMASDYVSLTFCSKPIKIQPLTGFIDLTSDTTYNINSRPASITGDYGIIGDNGQITKVESTSIVNETNNTYTNPSTGTTSTITDWTYDYSDRSYDLTLEGGDTVTVTYGDENITIQEGDTVYNVYYIVGSTGGSDVQPTPTPGTETCQHSYTSTIDREATCAVPGQMTYTCSLCGHTYTEAIPAKGHTWTVLQTVTTEYDQEGNLLQQGYTIYQCSACGEQYKDETGTGPPGSGDSSGEEGETIWDKLGNLIGSVFDGLLGVVEAVIGKILDALIALVEMISEKLEQVVTLVLGFFDYIPGLFTGFLGFLGAVFPFLPEDIMLLLTFGIAVVVFIGIIKALRR